jgi:hypothetical protein
MKSRCTNPKDISFKHYGGRGIRVTPEWIDPQNGYLNFLREVGERPSRAYTLDRKDTNGHYEPGNVRWILKKDQIANRRKIAAIQQFSDQELLSELERRGLITTNSGFAIAQRGLKILSDGSSPGLSVSELWCIGDPQVEMIGASYARQ